MLFRTIPFGKCLSEVENGKIVAYRDAGMPYEKNAQLISRTDKSIGNFIQKGKNEKRNKTCCI